MATPLLPPSCLPPINPPHKTIHLFTSPHPLATSLTTHLSHSHTVTHSPLPTPSSPPALGGAGADIILILLPPSILSPAEHLPPSDLRHLISSSILTLITILHATAPAMISRGTGRYIILSPSPGLATPGMAGAAAVRHALEALHDTLLYELAPQGVEICLMSLSPLRAEGEPAHEGEQHYPASSSVVGGMGEVRPMQGVYRATNSPAQHAVRMGEWVRGRERTRVGEVCRLVGEVCVAGVMPVRMAVGRGAVEMVREGGRGRLEEIEDWKGWGSGEEGEEDEDE